ncbi:hypothetical protein C2869_21265 [Saccharobesus litoralis]|uniref:TonB-dependent receptor n=1 Tax=Saccharobesus litoralis TaxID=2172099 RepID=A0A2S0VX31_9ALTE|nr:TonB-dependent receptor [Saccharobesus litoralis]AWB68771.1 hypothetical protein C2869_21265 [Saccharobesus litoralis]
MYKNFLFISMLALVSFTSVAKNHNSELDLFELSLEQLIDIPVSSASLFAESRISAAASVEKINEEEWLRWGARRNTDALLRTPSIQAYPTFFGGHAIAVRGYAQLLSVRGLATLIDGVPVNDMIFGSAQYNSEHTTLGVVDSIELVKGPGSTLYGTDAFHGTLQFNTYYRQKNEVKLGAQLASPDYQQANLKWSQEIPNVGWLNLSADSRNSEKWRWHYTNLNDNLLTARQTQYQAQSFNLKLHNAATQKLSYKISYHHNNMLGDEFVGGGHTFGYQQNDISMADQSINLWQASSQYQMTDASQIGIKTYLWNNKRLNSFEIGTGIFLQDHQLKTHSAQAFWQYQDQNRNRLYVGVENYQQKIAKSHTHIIDQQGQRQNTIEQAEQGATRKINSVFAQGRWVTPISPLSIELGIRLDDYQAFGNQTTPRLGAIYQIENNKTVKALYSTAFRAAVSLEQFGSTAIKGSQNIKPEEIETYELIWLHQLNDHLAYQVSYFHSHWQDGIISTAIDNDPVFSTQFQNSGENSSQGLEAAVKVKLDDWLLDLKSSYVASQNDITHINYVMFPKWMLNMGLSYQINQHSAIHANWTFKDQWQANQSENSQSLASYNRLDMAYYWQWRSDISFNLSVINLLNKTQYIPSVLGYPEGEIEPITRQLNLSLQWQY